MFRVSISRLRSWWSDATDDILGGDLNDDEGALAYHRLHPHRAPLTAQRPRRAGAVPPRSAHCISPVRAGGQVQRSASGSDRTVAS